MADTITQTCIGCEQEFDFLPGTLRLCDDCLDIKIHQDTSDDGDGRSFEEDMGRADFLRDQQRDGGTQ